MDGNFFSEDELAGLFDELDEQALENEIEELTENDKKETDASYNRFKEIIEKHRND